MAEETAAETAPAKAGAGKKIMLLSVLGILLLGGGGGAAWFLLEPFLLNLADRNELRFLKVSIKLELDRPEEKTDFQKKLPAIRDALLVLLSSKESQLLRTVNGKRRIREEIMTRVNGVMSKGKIANVFFTDFIIQ